MPFRTGRIQKTPPMDWQVCHALLEIFTPYKCGEHSSMDDNPLLLWERQ